MQEKIENTEEKGLYLDVACTCMHEIKRSTFYLGVVPTA